jgi:alanine racemase
VLRQAGCVTFFVADLAEGKRLRKVADAAIYILDGLPPGTAQVLPITPVR